MWVECSIILNIWYFYFKSSCPINKIFSSFIFTLPVKKYRITVQCDFCNVSFFLAFTFMNGDIVLRYVELGMSTSYFCLPATYEYKRTQLNNIANRCYLNEKCNYRNTGRKKVCMKKFFFNIKIKVRLLTKLKHSVESWSPAPAASL